MTDLINKREQEDRNIFKAQFQETKHFTLWVEVLSHKPEMSIKEINRAIDGIINDDSLTGFEKYEKINDYTTSWNIKIQSQIRNDEINAFELIDYNR